LIVLEFVSTIGFPGLMGIVTAAIVAAAMSSLDSSLNSMATVTTIDFYQKFFKKDGSPEHYLKASRWFTLFWAVFTVVPAMMFISSAGSVIEILSKVGSFFVGAKLAMFGLGFFSKHTTERGLIVGVVAGFVALWYVEFNMDVAWPWYCALGGVVSIVVAWVSSVLLDGFQDSYNLYTVRGQLRDYRERGLPMKKDGWYVVSGKVDKASYALLVFFVLCVAGLWTAQSLI
jgi:SSS family solute:Na+ symporter